MSDLDELRHRPLVFVDDLDNPRIDEDDLHHLGRVLRLATGDPVTIGDGSGRWRVAELAPSPASLGEIRRAVAPSSLLTVAFTPVKGTRPEWVVQKLTELGVDRIVPVVSERSVVRWDGAKSERQHRKMLNAARAACLQSRRLFLPRVDQVVPLTDLLDAAPAVALADPAGTAMEADDAVIVVGPEGGFAPSETAGERLVSLPGGILRAETAAVVAAAIACGLRAGLVDPARK